MTDDRAITPLGQENSANRNPNFNSSVQCAMSAVGNEVRNEVRLKHQASGEATHPNLGSFPPQNGPFLRVRSLLELFPRCRLES